MSGLEHHALISTDTKTFYQRAFLPKNNLTIGKSFFRKLGFYQLKWLSVENG